jgi:hypothetical protein
VWPFQRKTEAPADSGSRPAPAPVIRRDWTGLPPIQRLIGQHPLTAPSDRFSDDLATHHDPSVSTEPMGHQVSAEAPAGIVLALARPTTRNDGPAMISRPRVQRRVQSATEESGEWDGDGAASPAMRPSPLPAGTAPAAARELPVVTPAPVGQRLTTLSPEVEPVPVESAPRRSRIEQPLDPSAASRAELSDAPVAAPRLTLGQARRLGLGPPISRVPGRAVQRAIADPTEMPLAVDPSPRPSAARLEGEPPGAEPKAASSDETRSTPRLELPLAPRESSQTPHSDPPPQGGNEPSADSPVRRAEEISTEPPAQQATEPFGEIPTSGRTEIASNPVLTLPLVQRSLQGHRPQVAIESSAEPALPLATPQHAKDILRPPTLPSPTSGGGELLASPANGGAESWASPASTGGELWAAPTRREGLELAPLVGARPLRPTTLQRASVDLQEPMGRGPSTNLAGERADRTLQRTDSPEGLAAQPLAHSDDVVLRSWHESADGVPNRSLFSQERAHVASPPRQASDLPDRSLAVGRRLQLQAQAERSPSRAAELPLAPVQRAAAEVAPEPSDPGGESTSEVAQRARFDSLSSEVSSLSSRAPSPAEAGSAVSTVGSAVGSMFGGHNAAETDMDELAGKLYDKIRTRLKSELLVDRERSGFLTDLR